MASAGSPLRAPPRGDSVKPMLRSEPIAPGVTPMLKTTCNDFRHSDATQQQQQRRRRQQQLKRVLGIGSFSEDDLSAPVKRAATRVDSIQHSVLQLLVCAQRRHLNTEGACDGCGDRGSGSKGSGAASASSAASGGDSARRDRQSLGRDAATCARCAFLCASKRTRLPKVRKAFRKDPSPVIGSSRREDGSVGRRALEAEGRHEDEQLAQVAHLPNQEAGADQPAACSWRHGSGGHVAWGRLHASAHHRAHRLGAAADDVEELLQRGAKCQPHAQQAGQEGAASALAGGTSRPADIESMGVRTWLRRSFAPCGVMAMVTREGPPPSR